MVELLDPETATPLLSLPVVSQETLLAFEVRVSDGEFTAADSVEIRVSPDCDRNGIPDSEDLSGGSATDCDANQILDTCQLIEGGGTDCNGDGLLDGCQLQDNDCDANGIPDECDPAARDVAAFTAVLLGGELSGPPPCQFDANQDGTVDGLDIAAFVTRLLGQ
jgi:hypothetical protein